MSEWWASLRHGGMLLSPQRVIEFSAEAVEPPAPWLADRLRGDVLRLDGDASTANAMALIDTVLDRLCGFAEGVDSRWQRGNTVEARFARRSVTGETIKPRRVWFGPLGATLPVFVDDEARLGVGRGRRAVSRLLEWCRGTGHPLALLTNARQFRLIHVGAEHESWAEADSSQWFVGGEPGPQLEGLRRLLCPKNFTPKTAGQPAVLLDAILKSRQGQTQITGILGERVRQAVEVLIHAHGPYLRKHPEMELPEVYRAATMVVMRLVVLLFAESRKLLPVDSSPVYRSAYSLNVTGGLWDKLQRAGGGNTARLRKRYGAWPQVLALFRLIFEGSHHPELSIRRYGGELFRSGKADDQTPVGRVIHLFETAALQGDPPVMTDADVHEVLRLLTQTVTIIRQGNAGRAYPMPVDFSDLSTEYIGILYEGLLDYELQQAPAGDAILFLNLGDQPALPLSRLEGLDGNALKALFKEFKQTKTLAVGGEEEEEDAGAEGDAAEPAAEGDAPVEAEPAVLNDAPAEATTDSVRLRALAWARHAVLEAKVEKAYTGNDPVRRADNEEKLTRAANGLLARPPIMAGDYFLVRWGGTRKGQGSFYTRPGLVSPTVRRTLAPLCYDLPAEPGEADLRELAKPKSPGDILALKIADIGMGSASFLVSALRFLSEALFKSLLHHRWLEESNGSFTPGAGLPAGEPPWFRECVRDLPLALDAAEATIKARLKRLVVERCIYGVDLDPLAVELGRLALWIETMDRDLPFGFLDHKLKCGNSLVGCWFDRFQEFPALCLNRSGDDAGDKTHATAVHFPKGKLTETLKAFRDDQLKPALAHWIEAQQQIQLFNAPGQTPADLHANALTLFEEMHALPVHMTEERGVFYRERIVANPQFQQLRAAFDTWCALWFWPVDQLDQFPLPQNLTTPGQAAQAIVQQLRDRHRFFHWELEFPDVFTVAGSGFDALLGNPPWEVQKPNSKEFFSNHDPLYRTYGKQEALRRQSELFQIDGAVEREWIDYNARFKALVNWASEAAFPWGDPIDASTKLSIARGRVNAELHTQWRSRRVVRRGFADSNHPFRHQGSADLNTYKLFLEQMHALLRVNGRMGVIVPSNVYTDKGTTNLRMLFLDQCRWEWLFGFENREGIFDIHRAFKFCSLIIAKGGQTQSICTAFMRRQLVDWENAEQYALAYPRAQVTQFSPYSRSILEFRFTDDISILEKMYTKGVLLADDTARGWKVDFGREFHMTGDSKLFPPRPLWEAQEYMPDEYGHWLKGNWQPWSGITEGNSIIHRPTGVILSRDSIRAIKVDEIKDVALPLYEGRMIDHFDFSGKGWVSGKGRGAVWREIPWNNKIVEPQFLMGLFDARSRLNDRLGYLRIGIMDVGSATNERTMYANSSVWVPFGHSAPTIKLPMGSTANHLALLFLLNSFAYDQNLRLRVGGLHLSWHYLEESAILYCNESVALALAPYVASLSWTMRWFSEEWLDLAKEQPSLLNRSLNSLFCFTSGERLRVRAMLDAAAAFLIGLSYQEYNGVLRDCDHPRKVVSSDEFTRGLDPKGFWRVDKDRDPELRHTVLSLVAFRDLQRLGLEAFLNQNEGEGWMLPETLRLSDYGLGHDDRAREPQPVASRLGARFYPWQLEGTVADSWEECRRHAENLRRIRAIGIPVPEPAVSTDPGPAASTPAQASAPPKDLLGVPIERDLFGNEVTPKRKRGG